MLDAFQNSQTSKFSGTVFGRSCQYRAGELLSRVCRESFPEMSRAGELLSLGYMLLFQTMFLRDIDCHLKEMLYYTRVVISYLSFTSNLVCFRHFFQRLSSRQGHECKIMILSL